MSARTIGRQFDSDERAQAIFAAALESHFLIRPYRPDIFLDYHIEERKNGEPTAQRVFVQLKGQLNFRRVGNTCKVSIKQKHLKYYFINEEPVFIVVVDNNVGKAYYLFIQRWRDEKNLASSLRDSGTLSVEVPLSNELSVIPEFCANCASARAYMKEKFPGSPRAALAKVSELYANLDDRFEVKAYFTPEGERIQIEPKTAVSGINFHLRHDNMEEVGKQISANFHFGTPCSLANVSMSVEGSALLERLFSTTENLKVELRAQEHAAVSIEFSWRSGVDSSHFTIPGEITKGVSGISIHTVDTECPLSISTVLTPTDGIEGKLELSFDLKCWSEKALNSLPWFESIDSFSRAITQSTGVYFTVIHKGVRLFKGTIHSASPALMASFEGVMLLCELLGKAKELALHLGLNPITPASADLSERCWKEIIDAHKLYKEKVCRSTSLSTHFSLNDTLEPIPFFQDMKKNGESKGQLRAQIPNKFRLFNCDASLGYLMVRDVLVRIVPAKPIHFSDSETIEVIATPVDGSHFELVLVNEPELG